MKQVEELREYVCDHLCVHAVMDSDYLQVRCEECRLEELTNRLINKEKHTENHVVQRDIKENQQIPEWKQRFMSNFMKRE